MYEEIIISGFGGQGALFAGQVLAYAGMAEGRHVSWIPSYGPEMRGGTAHCTVILSDEEIGSPLVRRPSIAMVLNLPSLDKYEPLVRPGGVLVYNSSLITRVPTRTDIRVIPVPANDIAAELGDVRMANLVMVGALLTETGLVQPETIDAVLAEHLSERRRHLLEANKVAMRRGMALVQSPVAHPQAH
jgi:2-oxoglutarate ferredoxin oxidoreductase subunit gamma